MTQDYKTGYARPPIEHRFKPGRSGNPKGRPKKRPSVPDLITKVFIDEKFTARINGKEERINGLEAALKALLARVVKGDVKAIKLVLGSVRDLPPPREIDPREEEANALRSLTMDFISGKW